MIDIFCQACPASSKTHTTRRNRQAILTEDQTQLVISDTPGLIKDEEVKRFGLERELVTHPERSLAKADIILVAQDVSNRYVREAIDKRVLKLLCRYWQKPAFLVLTKVDILPKNRNVYDLIRKLTCNHLDGHDASLSVIKETHLKPRLSVDAYLKSKEAKGLKGPEKKKGQPESVKDFLESIRLRTSEEWTEEALKNRLHRVIGWPGFKEVFTVSSTDNTGIEELRTCLLSEAKDLSSVKDDRKYFSPLLKTTADPRSVVLSTVKAKAFEILRNEIPYELNPELSAWTVSEGSLKVGISISSKRPRCTGILLAKKVNLT